MGLHHLHKSNALRANKLCLENNALLSFANCVQYMKHFITIIISVVPRVTTVSYRRRLPPLALRPGALHVVSATKRDLNRYRGCLSTSQSQPWTNGRSVVSHKHRDIHRFLCEGNVRHTSRLQYNFTTEHHTKMQGLMGTFEERV
ncbi:hypothetical protein CBL_04214 [Carabus blaptoides fortunei]